MKNSKYRFQPLALGSSGGPAQSVLCVPCATDAGVHGALELLDKHGGERFTIDDVEVATLLGGIAGAALARSPKSAPATEPLERQIAELAATDPRRYAVLAEVAAALIARG